MSYYPEPDSHIRDKVEVVLDFSNYATKKELDCATGVNTSDLAAKKILKIKNCSCRLEKIKWCSRYWSC